MQSATKKTAAADPGQRALRSAGSAQGAGDAQSRQLARIQKRVGNSEAGTAVHGSATTRDEMMRFICERLKVISGVQTKEHKQFLEEREWYREVAKGTPGYTLPDPTRWHDAARDFKEAALALSHGNLSRGAQLLDRALEAERAAYEDLPEMVRADLVEEESAAASLPGAFSSATTLPVAPACAPPGELVLADRILNLTDQFKGLEPIHPWHSHHWWDEEEEEETDEDGKKGKPAAKEAPQGPAATEEKAPEPEKQPAREQEAPAPQKDRAEKRPKKERREDESGR